MLYLLGQLFLYQYKTATFLSFNTLMLLILLYLVLISLYLLSLFAFFLANFPSLYFLFFYSKVVGFLFDPSLWPDEFKRKQNLHLSLNSATHLLRNLGQVISLFGPQFPHP